MAEFDAIVVGSGISGGWAAKELCERGLKVLVLERGRAISAEDYTDTQDPWDMAHLDRVPEDERKADYPEQGKVYAFRNSTKHFWVKDSEHPYETRGDGQFSWRRGYHLGGRSIMWGRLSWRWGPDDFEANKRDGHGVDWPIRYSDLASWYDKVEEFIGVAGSRDGLEHVPDGPHLLPPFEFTPAEIEFKGNLEKAYPKRNLIHSRVANLRRATQTHTDLGRGQCQVRNMCYHGCSYGAYFSSLSATLPAAERTGNLTVVTNAIVQSLEYDEATQRITGVRVIDAGSKTGKVYTSKIVFLNASTIATASILLNSKSASMPNGLANHSDQVGRNIMDHIGGSRVEGRSRNNLDKYYRGRRPTGSYIPRYRNIGQQTEGYARGWAYQVYSYRGGWWNGHSGIGAELREKNRTPGPWSIVLDAFCEVLPHADNRITLHPSRTDAWGSPVPVIDAKPRANERALLQAAHRDALEMVKTAGLSDISTPWTPEQNMTEIGGRIHEMGTARMGRDPETSVLNGRNQAHDIPNLFITDGSCMTSAAVQNPSLTYMALTARAANYAADLLKEGVL